MPGCPQAVFARTYRAESADDFLGHQLDVWRDEGHRGVGHDLGLGGAESARH